MNRIFNKFLFIFFVCVVFFTSCEKYPVDALLGLNAPIAAWPDTWYLYDDEFNTKGNSEPYVWKDDPFCDSWNNATLDTKCTNAPQSGTRCIKFTWGGNSKSPEKTFFGFGMQSRNEIGGIIDLTNSGYKWLKFYVRGNLYNNCVFNLSIPDKITYSVTSSEITSTWQEVEIDITGVQMDNLKFVVGLALAVDKDGIPTNGGTVYIDNIRFTKD